MCDIGVRSLDPPPSPFPQREGVALRMSFSLGFLAFLTFSIVFFRCPLFRCAVFWLILVSFVFPCFLIYFLFFLFVSSVFFVSCSSPPHPAPTPPTPPPQHHSIPQERGGLPMGEGTKPKLYMYGAFGRRGPATETTYGKSKNKM